MTYGGWSICIFASLLKQLWFSRLYGRPNYNSVYLHLLLPKFIKYYEFIFLKNKYLFHFQNICSNFKHKFDFTLFSKYSNYSYIIYSCRHINLYINQQKNNLMSRLMLCSVHFIKKTLVFGFSDNYFDLCIFKKTYTHQNM